MDGPVKRTLWLWLRIVAVAVRENVMGIRCPCGARARLPAPRGWTFSTWYGSNTTWVCSECNQQDAEPPQW